MKRRLLRHVMFVSAGYYLSNGMYMVRGLILAWLLGPATFGVWAAMRMTQTFSGFAMLGSRQGMLQLSPLAEGRGHDHEAGVLRRVASGTNLAATLAVALLVAMFAAGRAGQQRAAWLVFAAGLVLTHLYQFYHAVLRSHQRFTRAAWSEIIAAAISSTLGLAAAAWFGLVGFLVVLALSYVAALLWVWRRGPQYPRPALHRTVVSRLVGIGFPVMASGVLVTLLWNVDKLLLWAMRDSASLGEYAVQASFTNVALLAPAAIATVLHPHLMRHLGQHRTPESIRPYLLRGGELVAVWSAPIIAVGFFTLHLPIRWWLAQYVAAIDPGRVLMLAASFSMIATVPATVMISLNGQLALCAIRLVAIAVAGAGGFLALRAGGGYIALALMLAAGLVIDGLLTLAGASAGTKLDLPASMRLVVTQLTPLVLMGAAVAGAWWLIPDAAARWQSDVAATAGRCAVATAVCVPWAVWRSRRLGLLR